MKFNSFKFRLSLLTSLVLGVVLLLYSYFLYWGLSVALYDDLDKELRTKANATVHVLGLYLKVAGDSPRVVDYVINRINFPEDVDARLEIVSKIDYYWTRQFEKLSMQDDLMHLISPSGSTLGRSKRLSNDLRQIFIEELKHGDQTSPVFSSIRYKNRYLRMVSVLCSFNDKAPYILQIAVSQKPIIQLLKSRLLAIITSIPVIFLLTFAIGFFFVSQLMRPVLEVTKAADAISHRDLSLRVPARYTDEEMRRLVAAFNDMIARLESSFKHIEEFSSQVAHELRTPLAIMRGESELALRKDRDPEEYKRVIRINLEELARMLKTVEDLLLLARLDYKPEIFKKESFDFYVFYREVFEQARVLADGKGITLEFVSSPQQVMVYGDKHHLRRLFFNLLHNAVKFTHVGGMIKMSLKTQSGKLWAHIVDNGVGISLEDQSKVFNRFFHKDQGVVTDEAGSGLGLSIAIAIARGHGGDISVHSQPGQGSDFFLSLPMVT
ncbi:MAG: HAMP domain-containing protein [Candidatus Omnitrophica bacterium]|nr:HAMP domain-containing protein [Candidatus Omnitrophota bacterium]